MDKLYKTSDCPICPTSKKLKEPASGFLGQLNNPALNALLHHDIDTVQKFSTHTMKEILIMHCIEKASLPAMGKVLRELGLSFKETE